MPFIHEDFLLHSDAARRLYHTFAKKQPIIDYHNHLPPRDIAENRQFANLWEIWLEGDHYKWRAMRADGVAENYCTGDAAPYEKFLAWARTVPHTLRNPLYHWTHLELKRYFGIEELLNEQSAPSIWERANERLATPERSTHGILHHFQVRALCTTDDPTDTLQFHRQIAASDLETRVYPAFRPDKALGVHQPEQFNRWTDKLAAAADTQISTLADFLTALEKRHTAFHQLGGRLSDHGLEACPSRYATDAEARILFDKTRSGTAATLDEQDAWTGFLMLHFGRWDNARGWTKQLHLGPIRNNNSRAFEQLGPDTGFDSIGDIPQAKALAGYLDRLARENSLPKMVLYNNNPNDNFIFVTMAGNFQDGKTAGKIQFGAAWWHLDQKEGIEWQLNALSNTGLLSRFIGMLTDSRSFLSFPRHEYFRRVLCNLIGGDIESGEIPDDDSLVGPLIENICYNNAKKFLGLAVAEEPKS